MQMSSTEKTDQGKKPNYMKNRYVHVLI